MQKAAKAVTKHSAQVDTGNTFAKKKAAEKPALRVYRTGSCVFSATIR